MTDSNLDYVPCYRKIIMSKDGPVVLNTELTAQFSILIWTGSTKIKSIFVSI